MGVSTCPPTLKVALDGFRASPPRRLWPKVSKGRKGDLTAKGLPHPIAAILNVRLHVHDFEL